VKELSGWQVGEVSEIQKRNLAVMAQLEKWQFFKLSNCWTAAANGLAQVLKWAFNPPRRRVAHGPYGLDVASTKVTQPNFKPTKRKNKWARPIFWVM
jgi:hypothetical protein